MGNPLKELEKFGQSPWLDFIQRSYIANGNLEKLVQEDGLKGVTSNPAIFEKAMAHGSEYDGQFRKLANENVVDVGTLYETMAVDDIKSAAQVLHPVWEKSAGVDGYVSLEVSPYLGTDTQATIDEAARLWRVVNKKNLMIKIPATAPCIPAIRRTIADGINVNVTLLFSLDTYKMVLDAYMEGLESILAKGGDISTIASVASFFVSRIDTMIDNQIDGRIQGGDVEREALQVIRGKVAIANAKMAYQHYLKVIQSARWRKLSRKGAKPQRLLWASTGTKDKSYSDVLYIDNLIGPDTVNTIPPATMDAFRDHGVCRQTLTEDITEAGSVLQEAERLGFDLNKVTTTLLDQGITLFCDSFDQLLGSIAEKQMKLQGERIVTIKEYLPLDILHSVEEEREIWRRKGKIRRILAHESSVWTGNDERDWLRWLDIIDERYSHISELQSFQDAIKAANYSDILLLGMGGSSLGPEVLAKTFGDQKGFPVLHVLDSTDPQQIQSFEKNIDLSRTLVIVSSKSGSTLEPNILKAYFWEKLYKIHGQKTGKYFVAVTDPGSDLEKVAQKEGFGWVFHGEKGIGGRYSVLSNFGLIPAAAMGLDLDAFLISAQRMQKACVSLSPPSVNPGALLGTFLGIGARDFKRDKVTIITSPIIGNLGSWLGQLLAESTGKNGRGLIPIDGEALMPPENYGDDRLFVYLRVKGDADLQQDKAVKALVDSRQPVVVIELTNKEQIIQEFFHWEFATAIAGAVLGVNPFDQPDVEASKIETRKLTDSYDKMKGLPAEEPFASFKGLEFYANADNARILAKAKSAQELFNLHFCRAGGGDYLAFLAYIECDVATRQWLQGIRYVLQNRLKLATVAEFGPRFLHSTGQVYKGGPNSGVFLQITADDACDIPVPGEEYSFGVVKAAQARGDFDVLSERGRRALRVHIRGGLSVGLRHLNQVITAEAK